MPTETVREVVRISREHSVTITEFFDVEVVKGEHEYRSAETMALDYIKLRIAMGKPVDWQVLKTEQAYRDSRSARYATEILPTEKKEV